MSDVLIAISNETVLMRPAACFAFNGEPQGFLTLCSWLLLLLPSCFPPAPSLFKFLLLSHIPLCHGVGSASSISAQGKAHNLGASPQPDEREFWMELQKRKVVPQLRISHVSSLPVSMLGINCVS